MWIVFIVRLITVPAFIVLSIWMVLQLINDIDKGKTLDEAESIKNTDIVEELSLPPVKIHCSVLAEDAIKAAIHDYKAKYV